MIQALIHDPWRSHQFIVMSILVISLAVQAYFRLGLIAASALGYCLFSALLVFQNPISHYGQVQTSVDGTSAIAFAILEMLAILALTLTYDASAFILSLFEAVAVLDSILMLILGYGLLNNSSMDAAFVALLIPRIYFVGQNRSSWIGAAITSLLCTATVLKAGGSTGVAILTVEALAWMAITKNPRILALPVLIACGAAFTLRHRLLESSGRFDLWTQCMAWWQLNTSAWFGTGIGTFEVLGPLIQNRQVSVFLFMHNEYLQLLFEGGVIGLVLGLALYSQCVVRSLKNAEWLTITWAGLGVAMLAQYPFRFMLSATFCTVLAVRTLKR